MTFWRQWYDIILFGEMGFQLEQSFIVLDLSQKAYLLMTFGSFFFFERAPVICRSYLLVGANYYLPTYGCRNPE